MDAAITVASPWKSVMNGRFSIKSRNPWEARTMCQTWPTSTNIARVFSWSAARERDEMLELYDRKLSRTVLRRESGSNPADLAGTIAGGFSPAGDTAEQVSRQLGEQTVMTGSVPFPVSWTVKMKKKQKETQDILSYHSQAAGCSDKARAKASGGRQPIEECGRTGL